MSHTASHNHAEEYTNNRRLQRPLPLASEQVAGSAKTAITLLRATRRTMHSSKRTEEVSAARASRRQRRAIQALAQLHASRLPAWVEAYPPAVFRATTRLRVPVQVVLTEMMGQWPSNRVPHRVTLPTRQMAPCYLYSGLPFGCRATRHSPSEPCYSTGSHSPRWQSLDARSAPNSPADQRCC